MTHNEATKLIVAILREKIRITSDALCNENFDKPLTGGTFGFNSVLLAYLLLELEKEAAVSFSKEDLADYGFNTINSIADLLVDKKAA